MGYIGVITHLLTIDPNFLGHPSRSIYRIYSFPIFPANIEFGFGGGNTVICGKFVCNLKNGPPEDEIALGKQHF